MMNIAVEANVFACINAGRANEFASTERVGDPTQGQIHSPLTMPVVVNPSHRFVDGDWFARVI